MDNLALWIYLAGMANGAKTILVAALLLSITLLVGVFVLDDDDEVQIKNPRVLVKRFLSFIIFASFLFVIIPSKQTIYLMVGITAFEDVAQTPELSKARKVLNQELDKMLEEGGA